MLKPEFHEGERVQILEGPYEGSIGVIASVDNDRRKLQILVLFFGRETTFKVDFLDLRKLRLDPPGTATRRRPTLQPSDR